MWCHAYYNRRPDKRAERTRSRADRRRHNCWHSEPRHSASVPRPSHRFPCMREAEVVAEAAAENSRVCSASDIRDLRPGCQPEDNTHSWVLCIGFAPDATLQSDKTRCSRSRIRCWAKSSPADRWSWIRRNTAAAEHLRKCSRCVSILPMSVRRILERHRRTRNSKCWTAPTRLLSTHPMSRCRIPNMEPVWSWLRCSNRHSTFVSARPLRLGRKLDRELAAGTSCWGRIDRPVPCSHPAPAPNVF